LISIFVKGKFFPKGIAQLVHPETLQIS